MKIVQYPHPALRHKSKPVQRVNLALREIVAEMFALMYAANGIGLAANQVNLPLRLFIVNLAAKKDEGEELVFINPVISRPRGSQEKEEGCLSLPGVYAPVKRPQKITFSAYGLQGEELQADLDGMMARVVQHETDHLDGVMFIDKLSSTHTQTIEQEVAEFELQFLQSRQRNEIPPDEEIAEHLHALETEYC